LVVVAALALAGARPAAAVDLNVMDRLAGLWATMAAGEPEGLWQGLMSWLGDAMKGGEGVPQPSTNHSMGSDPNGGPHVVEETPLGEGD
jgi:hypothetical protein